MNCGHLDITLFYNTTSDTRTIEEVCSDCGHIVKSLKEHIAPVKGIIDEAPIKICDERTGVNLTDGLPSR